MFSLFSTGDEQRNSIQKFGKQIARVNTVENCKEKENEWLLGDKVPLHGLADPILVTKVDH